MLCDDVWMKTQIYIHRSTLYLLTCNLAVGGVGRRGEDKGTLLRCYITDKDAFIDKQRYTSAKDRLIICVGVLICVCLAAASWQGTPETSNLRHLNFKI